MPRCWSALSDRVLVGGLRDGLGDSLGYGDHEVALVGVRLLHQVGWLVSVACLLSTGLSARRSQLGLVAGAAGAGFWGWIILCCSVRLFVSLNLIVSDASNILQIFTTFISYFLAFISCVLTRVIP